MNLTEMQTLLRFLVDDNVDSSVAVTLLNNGQNKMAVEVKCTFPQLDSGNTDSTFVFPEKYHELPVIYAASMYKAFDSSVRESQNYRDQFIEGLVNFTENYTPEPRYWDHYTVQQYTVSNIATKEYVITKLGYNPKYAELTVYLNDIKIDVTLDSSETKFTIPDTYTLGLGDKITASWEIHAEFANPPYPFWEGLP